MLIAGYLGSFILRASWICLSVHLPPSFFVLLLFIVQLFICRQSVISSRLSNFCKQAKDVVRFLTFSVSLRLLEIILERKTDKSCKTTVPIFARKYEIENEILGAVRKILRLNTNTVTQQSQPISYNRSENSS